MSGIFGCGLFVSLVLLAGVDAVGQDGSLRKLDGENGTRLADCGGHVGAAAIHGVPGLTIQQFVDMVLNEDPP